MARRNSRKNGKIWLDLNQIDNFAYALRKNKETVTQKLREVCDRWGTMTKSDYENRISYAGGFGSRGQRGKKAFYTLSHRIVEQGTAHEWMQVEDIVSQGDNYIRYASGLQICWGIQRVGTNSAIGINYPLPFVAPPAIVANVSNNGSGYVRIGDASATNYQSFFLVGQGDLSAFDSTAFTWQAIGRWK